MATGGPIESRHVKYGCIGCSGILALIAIFATVVVLFVFSLVKSSDAYVLGVQRATNSPIAQELLGKPIVTGAFVSGSVNVNGAAGTADLAVPLSGPKGDGTLYIQATKLAGQWDFDQLYLTPDGGDRVSLLGGGAP